MANVPVVRTSVHGILSAKRRRATEGAASAGSLHIEIAHSRGQPSGTSFPTLRRSRALEGDPRAREKAEAAKRQHWISELRSLVLISDMPTVLAARAYRDPNVILSVVSQGRRAATLCRRTLDRKRAGRFFHVLTGTAWPKGPHDVLDYLNCLASSGVGRSALGRAAQALTFLERAGGVQQERQLSQSPLVKAAVEELVVVASTGGTKPVRKSPQAAVFLMPSCDSMALDTACPLYWRLLA